MKQGVLITAYKNFEHLIEIASCFDENFEIYIHIDKKSKVCDSIINELNSLKNVSLVSRKYKVNWGGLNHLKCILHLTEEVLRNQDITTFHLVSGHDYPVKSSTYFYEFFKRLPKTDFLSYFELPDKRWPNGGLDRLEYYNLYDVLDAKNIDLIFLDWLIFKENGILKDEFQKKYQSYMVEILGGACLEKL